MTSLKFWRSRGFLPIEQREFSTLPIETVKSVQYIKDMINERAVIYEAARQSGMSVRDYKLTVLADYQAKGIGAINTKGVWALYKLRRRAIISSGGDPSPGLPPNRPHRSRKDITRLDLQRQASQQKTREKIDKWAGW